MCMNTRSLFHLVMAFNLLLAALPLRAALAAPVDSTAPADLLQFTAGGHALGFTAGGMYAATGTHALHVDFAGANTARPQADSPATADGKTAPLGRVTYADLWDGITLTFAADAGNIYTTSYTLAPGADPGEIRLNYNAPLTVNEDGTLSIAFETGVMTESAPIAWQEIDGERVPVDVSFQVSGKEAGFTLGAYDLRHSLTIDPNLTWNTFLGASGEDKGTGIAVDGSGNVYVTGVSNASWSNPVRAYSGGGVDAFVAKFSTTGSLTWNTFLGGSGSDQGTGIAVDGSGNIYVTGGSSATWGSPVRAHSGNNDTFAAKLDSAGGLTWNTFLGGSGADYGYGIAVDGSGNVYVTGDSTAAWTCPEACTGRAYTGGYDAFAAGLNSAGGLTWNTFLGGNGADYGYGIAVDGSGHIYVTGFGNTAWGSPVHEYTGAWDAFAVKLASGGALFWSTFLGGDGFDYGYGIAVDGSGNVYVAGYSGATWGSPVIAYTGGYDAFAAKLTSAGALTWNSFLGGSGDDRSYAIAVDGGGNVYLTGYSSATWGSPVRTYSGDSCDAFAAKLTSAGMLTWNTFLGGGYGIDESHGIAVDGSGNVYLTGQSYWDWGNPVGPHNGGYDVFAAKLDSAGSLTWNTFQGGNGLDIGEGIAVDGSGNVFVTGVSWAAWGLPVRAFSGSQDAFVAKLDPAGSLVWNTFLGGSHDDHGYGIAVDNSGNVHVTGFSYNTWGAPVRAYDGGYDSFAAKLDSGGSLIWNTFLGGNGSDYGTGVAVDGSGNVYLAGYSFITWGSPVRAHTGSYDAFAAKLNSAGSLAWNTFLGGSGSDRCAGIALDGTGNIFVTGDGDAAWGTPVRAYTGFTDAFTAKLNSAGSLTWNTFLGQSGQDGGKSLAVDGSGNVYVTGYSDHTWGSPVRAFTSSSGDAFAAKLDSTGSLTWNTFLGGSGSDVGHSIAVDESGNVYVTGISYGTWGSPVLPYNGGYDTFIAKMSQTPPGAFGKTSPANTAYVTTSPTLIWSAGSGAASYEYCVDMPNNNTCDTSWVSTGSSTSAGLSGLGNNDTYYWQGARGQHRRSHRGRWRRLVELHRPQPDLFRCADHPSLLGRNRSLLQRRDHHRLRRQPAPVLPG